MENIEEIKKEFIDELKGVFVSKEDFENWRASQKSIPNIETKEEKGFSKWLKEVMVKQMAEGTGSAGGYLVPPEYVNRILDITKITSIVLPRADVFPVSSNVAYIPTLTSGVSFVWTAENQEGTATQPTFGQVSMAIKEALGIVYISNALLEDQNLGPDLDRYLVNLFGSAMAKEVDRLALTGNTSSGDPFNGILNTANTVTVRSSSTTGIDYDSLIDVIFSLNDDKAIDPVWIGHRTFYAKCFKLKDDNGLPILNPTAKDLLGYPFFRSERMPSTYQADEPIAIFGDLKNVRIGLRRDLTIETSKDVRFTYDQTVIRAKFRLGIAIYDPSAFCVYKTAST